MENFFMSEAQAAREEEEEAARRRSEVFKPSYGKGESLPSSMSFTSSSSSPSSLLSVAGSSVRGLAQQETAPETATAGSTAATSEDSVADATGDVPTAPEDVDPLDMYMSSIKEEVKKQDEEIRQRQQREAAAAAAAAAEQAAGGSAAAPGGTTNGGQQQHIGLQRDPNLEISTLSSAASSPGSSASSSSSSSPGCSQRIFADDDDPLADSFEHILSERQRAAEAQAARAAHGARKRKGDADDFVSDDENVDEERTKSKVLPSIDHSMWLYPSYVKDIYKEFKQIEELTHAEVGELKRSLQLRTFGKNVPRPIASFLHLQNTFSSALFTGLHKRGFSLPTPIQSAAIPCLLRGRDLLAVAETGSGKTAAYLIPLLARLQHMQEQQQWGRQHVVSSDEMQAVAASADAKGSSYKAAASRGLLPHGGPAALVICPTRELAVQLDGEVHALVSKSKKGAAALMLRRVLLAGGFDKTEQFRQLKQGVDLAICTPGRVIDTAATKGMHNFFQKVVAVVVDEADKLVDMGFEASLRSILNSVRPDRLTAMFSATFSPACESLARQFLDNPIKIIVGEQGQAAKAVEQNVVIVGDEKKKFRWLADNILSLLARPPPRASASAAEAAASCEEEQQQGRVAVIFCNTQQRCEDLAHLLEEEISQLLQRRTESNQQKQQEQAGVAAQGDGQCTGGETVTERDAASTAAAAPNTRTAAARLLQLETDENPSVLKRNPHQTFKYSTVVHGGLNLTERLAAIRRLHQHILHPSSDSSSRSLPAGVAAPLLLIATDVASRGLDFPGALGLVVSYDAPQEAEVYIHRIGRAGRAGRRGRSYALLTRAEKRAAAFIVESMRTVEQEPPRHLLDLAMLYAPFKTATLAGVKMQEPKRQSGKKSGRYLDNGLAGLGYSRDEAGERSSSPSRKKGRSVASLVARAAAAAAEALKQQQQTTTAAVGGSDGAINSAEGTAGEGGAGGGTPAGAADTCSGKAGAAELHAHKQQQQGGSRRGRWDSDEKKGSAPGNALDSIRVGGSRASSLLHSTDSTGLNAAGGSGTTATGKVVSIHDELSSDEDEATPGALQQQQYIPLQQQQYFVPQQQQQHYAPGQPAFQHPVEPHRQFFDRQQHQQQTLQQPYYQQQGYSQQPQQELQHPHNAEVEAIVQQAAAVAAAAARAAAAQVVASKASGYAPFGSSSCHPAQASGIPASAVSITGDASYDNTRAGGAPGASAGASVPACAKLAASCVAQEAPAAAAFGGAENAVPVWATGPLLTAATSGPPLSAAGSGASSAPLPKRPSVLNLEKREQRRKQWLVSAEARREQLRLQQTVAAQKDQQQRDPSPARKSFSERPHSTAAAGRTVGRGAAAHGAGGGGAGLLSGNAAGNAGRVG